MHKLIAIFVLLVLISASFPQEGTNKKFQRALNRFNVQKYDEALKLFREISSTVTAADKSAALLLAGKTELKLNRISNAKSTVVDFMKKYPDSRYMDEARVTLAKIYLQNDDAVSALKEMMYLIEESESGDYVKFGKQTGRQIASGYLNTGNLEQLLPSAPGKESKPFLLLLTGKAYLKENNKLEADAAFIEIIELFPESEEFDEAEILFREENKERQVISDAGESIPVIAVLLPLTTSGSEEQQKSMAEILEGIKFAFSEYNSQAEQKVGMLVRNTNNSPAEIEDLRKELERIPFLKLILGPVFSDEVRAALRVFNEKNIPILSPTATDDELTEMNNYFFQANPSFAMRGRAMAQYIYFVENKRKIGVLNAVEGYSPSIALSFTSEFERLGGEITVRETYRSGSFELDEQVRRISSYIGSLDGLFIPLTDKTDAPVILNELLMNNVNLPIYGNQDWFYSKVSSGSSGLNDQLTFTSDHFIDYNNSEYQQFAKNFLSQTSMDANRNVLYGYDAARYIFYVVQDWDQTPIQIKKSFESGMKMDGYHNDICFDEQRVNKYLNIIRYRDGIFELIDKFKTGTN